MTQVRDPDSVRRRSCCWAIYQPSICCYICNTKLERVECSGLRVRLAKQRGKSIALGMTQTGLSASHVFHNFAQKLRAAVNQPGIKLN
jgi:hypothetical protein